MTAMLPVEILLSIAAYLNCQEQYTLLRALPSLASQFSYTRHLLADTDDNGNNLVHILAANGEESLLKSLFPDEDLETSLSSGNVIPRLRQMFVTLSVNNDRATALHLAAEQGHVGVVEWISKKPGVDLNRPDKFGCTCVEKAAKAGHAEVVSFLLDHPSLKVDWTSNQRSNPLCLAAEHGHEATVRVILERHGHTISVNSQAAYGITPLTFAVIRKHQAITELLIQQKGINVNAEDHLGNSTLHMAVRSKNHAALKSLLAHPKVNPNIRDWYGHTPLQEAVCMADKTTVELLLQHFATDVNLGNCKKTTPLIKAVQESHEWVVELLLKRHEIEPDKKDYWGMTALAWAAFLGREKIAAALLEREDVDPNAMDEDGVTPLSLSMQMGWPEMAELLLKNPMVKINLEDNYGWTALAHAKNAPRSKSVALMKLLLQNGATMTLYAEMTVMYNALSESDIALDMVKSMVASHDLEAYMMERFGKDKTELAIIDGERGVKSLLFRDTKAARMRRDGLEGMLCLEGMGFSYG
ncbi:ankyrin repeat-containing domain protein [Trichoderma chlorosporum]